MPVSNTLTSFVDKLLAQGVIALRENCVITRHVNTSYRVQTGTRGSVIEVPIPSSLVTGNVTPGETVTATQAMAPTTALVPMDQWKEAAFTFTDQEVHQVQSGIFPSQASEGIKALCNGVASYLYGKYTQTWNYVGDPAALAFGGSTGTAHSRALRKKLTTQLAPVTDRFAILSPDVTESATGVDTFAKVNESGSSETIREGSLGRKFGFDWFEDQLMPVHATGDTGGTGVDTVVNGVNALGATTVNLTVGATNALALVVGDIIDFGVSGEYYTVTAAAAAAALGSVAVLIDPPLRTATAGAEVVSCLGNVSGLGVDYEVNIGAHRDGFAFASVQSAEMDLAKLLGIDNIATGDMVDRQITDSVTGLSLRLIIARQHYQYRVAWSMLYGASIPRPQLVSRLVSVAP